MPRLSSLLPLVMLLSACASASQLNEREGVKVHTLRIGHANTHIIQTRDRVFMVDAGHAHNASELDAKIRELGVDPKDIAVIVITHGHADHAGGAAYFKKTYGTPLIAGRGDHALLEQGKMGKLCPTDFIARQRHERAEASTYPPVTPTTWVDEEAISLKQAYGIDATVHFFMCDLGDNRADIAAMLKAHPKLEVFFTGHFGPVTREAVEQLLKEWPEQE